MTQMLAEFFLCVQNLEYNLFEFSNEQFRSVLRSRLIMSQVGITHGAICFCGGSFDAHGQHECNNSNRIGKHDKVTDVTQCALRSNNGVRSRKEPSLGDGTNRRGDISVNIAGDINSYILDVSIVNSYPPNGGVISEREVMDVEHTKKVMQRRYAAKLNSYAAAAEIANFKCVPCIMDNGGQMHEKFKSFLKQVLKQAAQQRNIPFAIIWNYWCCAITAALLKGRADSILGLTKRVFGDNSLGTYESSDLVISRSCYINCM